MAREGVHDADRALLLQDKGVVVDLTQRTACLLSKLDEAGAVPGFEEFEYFAPCVLHGAAT